MWILGKYWKKKSLLQWSRGRSLTHFLASLQYLYRQVGSQKGPDILQTYSQCGQGIGPILPAPSHVAAFPSTDSTPDSPAWQQILSYALELLLQNL